MAPRRGPRQLRRESRRKSIDEARWQVQGRDSEQDAIDAEQRTHFAIHGAAAGIRELMQATVRLQETQRLLQDSVALLG